jgi:hypothetical protein
MRIDNAALRHRIVMLVQEIGGDVERVEGAVVAFDRQQKVRSFGRFARGT